MMLTNTDKIMNDTFWIGVWPGIGEAERSYIVSIFVEMVRHFYPAKRQIS